MRYEIVGDNLQMVVVRLSAGEMVYGEAGAMVYMSENMEVNCPSSRGFMPSSCWSSGKGWFTHPHTSERRPDACQLHAFIARNLRTL